MSMDLIVSWGLSCLKMSFYKITNIIFHHWVLQVDSPHKNGKHNP